MQTYRELVYLVLDELKNLSDDRYFEEEHILFLLEKYRAFIIKQKYSDIKKYIPESNYQTLIIPLEHIPSQESLIIDETRYLRTTKVIPFFLEMGNVKVTSEDFFRAEFAYISRERFRYIGENSFLKNIIYSTLNVDNHIYLKSGNPQFSHLETIRITAIFSSPIEVYKLLQEINPNPNFEILDCVCPIEDTLVPIIIPLIVKELSGAIYRPENMKNNSADDFNGLDKTAQTDGKS